MKFHGKYEPFDVLMNSIHIEHFINLRFLRIVIHLMQRELIIQLVIINYNNHLFEYSSTQRRIPLVEFADCLCKIHGYPFHISIVWILINLNFAFVMATRYSFQYWMNPFQFSCWQPIQSAIDWTCYLFSYIHSISRNR